MRPIIFSLSSLLLFLLSNAVLIAQNTTITTEKTILKTYPFGDPNPVPILLSNPKIYPYFTYEGYAFEGQPQDWNVIHLENEHIDVWVLPEVGGKVWGAKEKTTGEEFIYRNEVMKFRNIAMRGPWTSGGIEFNFGIIGHHPSTATPVDYALVEEADGSVSCWVGNMDLSSRTQWRVKIHLPKDKAYFETQSLWYNPTSMHQSYYNWMTAAAFATEDLEFYCPGDQYLEHSGDPHPWPHEYGRHLAEYRENDFLSSKSYHVVGEYNDFFGGYFHESGYGFGHWSPYDEMPGQKLWLWSLARNGGIWEDLLTDTDGQYIEFQAGRLFDQYSPGGGYNPITQAVFPPHVADKWQEIWFPVKAIGGLSDVSPSAVLHVEQEGDAMLIGINALEESKGTLRVFSGGQLLLERSLALSPMEVFSESIEWAAEDVPFKVTVEGMGLSYDSDPAVRELKRPFEKPVINDIPTSETHFRQGLESMDFREYTKAEVSFKECLRANPVHLEALSSLGELYYRQGLYDRGLEQALSALSIDTYHPYANYVAGILFQAKGDAVNALETLGWAARSMEYRSAAYGIMAAIHLGEDQLPEAIKYASQALDYNRYNVQAHQVLATANRLAGKQDQAQHWIDVLLKIDPLCHFARFEQYLLRKDERTKNNFIDNIRNEFPDQSFLEIAVTYANWNQIETALQVLELVPQPSALINIWEAYLQDDARLLSDALTASPDFVFPFRRETLQVLEWAKEHTDHWKTRYYLALNYWGKERHEAAIQLFEAVADEADFVPFYLARAHLREQHGRQGAVDDLQTALSLQAENWRTSHAMAQYFHRNGMPERALEISKSALRIHPENYTIGMDYVRGLVSTDHYTEALEILKELKVLPFEGASESRRLYEWAHLGRALEQISKEQYQAALNTLEQFKQWPERLGVGKPYHPDERLADYLLAYIYRKTGRQEMADEAKDRILTYTREFPLQNSPNAVLGFQLMPEADLSELAINYYREKESLPIPLQWALAKALRDSSLVQALKDRHKQTFGNRGFLFLQQALDLTKP